MPAPRRARPGAAAPRRDAARAARAAAGRRALVRRARIGYPDPTRSADVPAGSAWLDALAAETGIPPERTVLGGFSQGAVMTYALGLGAGRPRPRGADRAQRLHPDRRGLGARPRAASSRRSRSGTARTTRSSASSGGGGRATTLEAAGADGHLPRVADAARNRPGFAHGHREGRQPRRSVATNASRAAVSNGVSSNGTSCADRLVVGDGRLRSPSTSGRATPPLTGVTRCSQ